MSWRDHKAKGTRIDGDEPYEVEDVEVIHETDMALKCIIYDEEKWVPKSAVCDDSDVSSKGDKGTLTVKYWWLKKEGLADE